MASIDEFLIGAQTQLFPPPQFLYDPRLNGASYPVHQNAQSYMYNPLWAANFAKASQVFPYLYPPGLTAADYEAAVSKGGKQSKQSNGPPSNRSNGPPQKVNGQMQSPSQRSFASSNGDKASKNSKTLPQVVPQPAVNASVSLNQTKSELFEKTKKLQEKEDESKNFKT